MAGMAKRRKITGGSGEIAHQNRILTFDGADLEKGIVNASYTKKDKDGNDEKVSVQVFVEGLKSTYDKNPAYAENMVPAKEGALIQFEDCVYTGKGKITARFCTPLTQFPSQNELVKYGYGSVYVNNDETRAVLNLIDRNAPSGVIDGNGEALDKKELMAKLQEAFEQAQDYLVKEFHPRDDVPSGSLLVEILAGDGKSFTTAFLLSAKNDDTGNYEKVEFDAREAAELITSDAKEAGVDISEIKSVAFATDAMLFYGKKSVQNAKALGRFFGGRKNVAVLPMVFDSEGNFVSAKEMRRGIPDDAFPVGTVAKATLGNGKLREHNGRFYPKEVSEGAAVVYTATNGLDQETRDRIVGSFIEAWKSGSKNAASASSNTSVGKPSEQNDQAPNGDFREPEPIQINDDLPF
ncbi:MAG: hypothetical protein D6732_18155 [Methanobacteriota archaeon]|nr:MAG: hypothetical protein D6732_18155 [Euryarchaeota archaeon]